VKAADVMTREVVTIGPQQPLRDALALFQRLRIRHLPVVEEGRVVGIVTDRDLKRTTPSRVSGANVDDFDRVLDQVTIGQVMTKEPWVVGPEADLKFVAAVLVDKKYGALPVVRDGALVGIVSDIDLLRLLIKLLP
jgi:acetoin utilization protein AcuB